MAVLIHWFPERRFILVGDGGYASHELARFCQRHRRHVTLVSRFYPQANLYDPPATARRRQGGRPRLKGRKRATPQATVQQSKGRRFTVRWYGGQTRRVELTSGMGHWYQAGAGLAPVRWVFVHDVQGTHRDEYLYSTDPSWRPDRIVSLFTARWSIEVHVPGSPRPSGLHYAAQLVGQECAADRAVSAGPVQSGDSDFRSPDPRSAVRTRRQPQDDRL